MADGQKESKKKQSNLKAQMSMAFAGVTLGLLLLGMVILKVVSGGGFSGITDILLVAGLPVVLAVLGGVAYYYLLQYFFTPVDVIIETMRRVNHERDLTIQMDVKWYNDLGYIANGFNKAVGGMRVLIAKGVDVVNGSDERMEGISHAISEITGGVEEVTSSVNEFSSSAQELDQNAQDMLAASNTAAEEIRIGRDGVLKSTKQISDATEQLGQVDPYVEKLNQHSEAIGRVVGIITEIAEETKLLAFNASIEAARAGEHGQGFAVVADEVRTLADQSSKAAKEISAMIGGVQQEVKQTQEVLRDGVDNIKQSASEVRGIEDIFGKISDYIEDMGGRVNKIASSAREISTGSEDLAAVMEEQTASIQEISSNVETVHQELNQFTTELQIFKS